MQQLKSLTNVSIRRARESDQANLTKLRSTVDGQASWLSTLQSDTVFTYLAEDTSPFGYVTVGQSDVAFDDRGVAAGEIIALYLSADYRGFGMGKKLLVRGLSILKRREFESAHIWLPDSATRAKGMILSLGFEPDSSERYSNISEDKVIVDFGFQLSLTDYF